MSASVLSVLEGEEYELGEKLGRKVVVDYTYWESIYKGCMVDLNNREHISEFGLYELAKKLVYAKAQMDKYLLGR